MLRKCVTVFAVLGVLTLGCFAQVPKRFRAESLHSRHGFHWTVEHSRHYEFYFEGGSPAARDIEHIETVLENNYAHIVVLLGGKDPDLATKAFVVDSRARMKQLTGRESNGLSVGDVLLFVYGDSVKALGAHEETHLLSYRLWGKPRGIWLAEGLAVYADNDWQGEPLNRICKRLK